MNTESGGSVAGCRPDFFGSFGGNRSVRPGPFQYFLCLEGKL